MWQCQIFNRTLRDGIKGLRIGVPRSGWFDENLGIDPQTEAVFNQALDVLKSLGAIVSDIDGKPFSRARKANQTILVCEAYAYHEKTYQETPMKFGTSVRRRMLEGAFLSAADYIGAQRARAVLNEQIRANFLPRRCFRRARRATPAGSVRDHGPQRTKSPAELYQSLQPDRPSRHLCSVRLHRGEFARRIADSRSRLRRNDGAAGGVCLRAGHRVAHAQTSAIAPCNSCRSSNGSSAQSTQARPSRYSLRILYRKSADARNNSNGRIDNRFVERLCAGRFCPQ